MYSRSYGMIEAVEKNGFSIPPDYHGNLYRKQEAEAAPAPPKIEEKPEKKASPPIPSEEAKPPLPSGSGGSFLERLTAEDILLFVFLYSLLRGDREEGSEVLGLILALLLL